MNASTPIENEDIYGTQVYDQDHNDGEDGFNNENPHEYYTGSQYNGDDNEADQGDNEDEGEDEGEGEGGGEGGGGGGGKGEDEDEDEDGDRDGDGDGDRDGGYGDEAGSNYGRVCFFCVTAINVLYQMNSTMVNRMKVKLVRSTHRILLLLMFYL